MQNIQHFLHNSEKIAHINAEYDSVVRFFSQYSNGDYPREIHRYIIKTQLLVERSEVGIDQLLSVKKEIEQQIANSRILKEQKERERQASEQPEKEERPIRFKGLVITIFIYILIVLLYNIWKGFILLIYMYTRI